MAKKKDQIKIKRIESDDNMDYLLNAPRYKKRHGALTGALLGGAIGAGVSKKNRLLGGLIGAGIGGLGGFSMVKNRNDWQDWEQQRAIDKINKYLDSEKGDLELTDNEGIFLSRLQDSLEKEMKTKKQANYNRYLLIKSARSDKDRASYVYPIDGHIVENASNNIYDFFQGLRPKSVNIEQAIPQDNLGRAGRTVIRPHIAQRGEITNNDGSKIRFSNTMPTVPDETTVDDLLNNRQKSTIGRANAELIYDYLRAGKNVPERLLDDGTSEPVFPSEIPAAQGNPMRWMPSDVSTSREGTLGGLININYDKDPEGWKRLANEMGRDYLYSDPKSYTMYKNLFGIGGGLAGGLGGYGLGSGISSLLGWNKPRYRSAKDKNKGKRRLLKGLSTLGGAGLGIYLGRRAGQPWDEDNFRWNYDQSTAKKDHSWLGESQDYKNRMNYYLNRQLEDDRERVMEGARNKAVSNLDKLLRTENLDAYVK